MVMGKYYFEDRELSLEEPYLAMEISLREQASIDLVEAKLNEEIIHIWQEDQYGISTTWRPNLY